MIEITTEDRIRTLRLNRPETKNAFNEALYDATANALIEAASDDTVAVVVITGTGDSFSSGNDLKEMALGNQGKLVRGEHGFAGLAEQLISFPKPLICAVNGMGVGIGATILGHADLVFMSSAARLKCPFTSLGLAPEAASSSTFPRLLGRQNATWALLSSEWLSADECMEMGLVFRVCEPSELLAETMRHATVLAAKPISSLIESKRTITEPIRDQLRAARAREDAAFGKLLGAPANVEALMAFAEKREPNFAAVDQIPKQTR